MADLNILIYLLRRDLRISDNPILDHLATYKDHGFTHLLPLYIFTAEQIELSGFIIDENTKSPYPEARSPLGNLWRCGPRRAEFLAESIWDLKVGLEKIGSGLCIRAGRVADVMSIILGFGGSNNIGAVWVTEEEGVEEGRDENDIKLACRKVGADFRLWADEKYLIDDRDLPFKSLQDLPDVYTTYRNLFEPLRGKSRPLLSTPDPNSLPPFPPKNALPPQHAPFTIPNSLEAIKTALLKPLTSKPIIKDSPSYPAEAQSMYPFQGGETQAKIRLVYLLTSGFLKTCNSTRDKLLEIDATSKLSGYLALGSITSRQIDTCLIAFEDGLLIPLTEDWKGAPGFGGGENEGTKLLRAELLWRDYMHLSARKFGYRLFHLGGFKDVEGVEQKWARPGKPVKGVAEEQVTKTLERFLNGTTGMGLIDASQREVYLTGYTSNRARQNTASFLVHHLSLDWRLGAEWYEYALVDYHVSSNWGNWQYVAGVGNDPRRDRILNPVKQADEYDPRGEYIKAWVPELGGLTDLGEIFQAWTCRDETLKKKIGLKGLDLVEMPLKKIYYVFWRDGRR